MGNQPLHRLYVTLVALGLLCLALNTGCNEIIPPPGGVDASASAPDDVQTERPSRGQARETIGVDAEEPEQGCIPGDRKCSANGIEVCDEAGMTWLQEEGCSEGLICFDGLCMECFPGTYGCDGVMRRRCSEEGVWYNEQDCQAGGKDCLLGACVSPCFEDYKSNTYSGCDYWAVDMDNVADAQDGAYALLVANLADVATDITVTRRDSAEVITQTAYATQLQPGALEVIQLPQRHLGAAGVGWNAWRLETTNPVVAYQFNPLSNIDVFSNDATLLLPVHTFGKHYILVTQPQLLGVGAGGEGKAPYRGTASIVTTSSDTTVTIIPTTRTLAGNDLPAMLPGQTYTVPLQPYQLLNIKSDEEGGDLTGTEIFANKPIGVFSGHESALSSDACCTDHLEQQLYSVDDWGLRYVATKAMPRNAESDYWRVTASEDQTTVTFTPAVAAPVVLQKGEFYELATTLDFMVEADRPVLVTQLLASSGEVVQPPAGTPCESSAECHPGDSCDILDTLYRGCAAPTCSGPDDTCLDGHTCRCSEGDEGDVDADEEGPSCLCVPIGDPSLILAAPAEEYRSSYIFLTPGQYAFDYINVIAPTGAIVTLDDVGLDGSAFVPITGSPYYVARLPVSDGIHSISASAPISVVVYGYDDDVSYGYLGGLGLHDIGHRQR